ncbi:MAG TPA: hypothetical protein PLP42_02050 [Acidobacteriota bacterium]|nr:hypothetical protein [Acidobacteriota bacterium]
MSSKFDPNPGQLDELPTIPHRVLYAGIPFYSDPECKNQVTDGTILILEALDPDDPVQELDVAPTRKNYEPGQIVAWDLNNKKLWEKCWYRNPETGNIEQAWTYHVEFIGKVVSPRALEANSERLQQLQAAMKPRPTPQIN